MRTLNLLSGVGVAIVGAWLAVTNLAYADEFTCVVPWSGDTDCDLPKFSIPPQGLLTVEVYSIQDNDGNQPKEAALFKVYDANKEGVMVKDFSASARTTVTWKYESKEKALMAQLRVNHPQTARITIRGRYTVSN